MADNEPAYKVYDVTTIEECRDLEDWLNKADSKGYELVQVLEGV